MILQLEPSLMIETPLGTGQALFIIDYGMHQNTCWVVALIKDGIIKHFDCNDIVLSTNYTYGLNLTKTKEPTLKSDSSEKAQKSTTCKCFKCEET